MTTPEPMEIPDFPTVDWWKNLLREWIRQGGCPVDEDLMLDRAGSYYT